MSSCHGDYLVGDEISLADACFMPQYRNACQRFNLDHTNYPILHQVYKNLCKIKAFKDAFPENQNDCPENVKKELLEFKL